MEKSDIFEKFLLGGASVDDSRSYSSWGRFRFIFGLLCQRKLKVIAIEFTKIVEKGLSFRDLIMSRISYLMELLESLIERRDGLKVR